MRLLTAARAATSPLVLTIVLTTSPATATDAPVATGHDPTQRSLSLGSQVVIDWNVIALRTTAGAPFDPPRETRSMAIVQAAVHDAVVAATDSRRRPYAVSVVRPATGSAASAAATAAHDTLAGLYPDQRSALDLDYSTTMASLPAGPNTERGMVLGRTTAAAVLAQRAGDGSDAVDDYEPTAGPGRWQPTPPAFRPALDPGWGRVTPFLLDSPDQVRPMSPPDPDESAYTRDFLEIAEIGSADSASRTVQQTETARFWVATAPQLWNQPVQQLVARRRLHVTDAAAAFALLNLAGADAFIAAWDAKFAFEQWRPVTAIRAADADGNPDTSADPRGRRSW